MRRVLILVAVAWSAAVFLHLLSSPVYQGIASRSVIHARETTELGAAVPTTSSVLAVNGPRVLGALMLPLLVSGSALLATFIGSYRSSSIVAACSGAVLSAFSILAVLSIGAYYMPAALLLLLGAAVPDRFSRFNERGL